MAEKNLDPTGIPLCGPLEPPSRDGGSSLEMSTSGLQGAEGGARVDSEAVSAGQAGQRLRSQQPKRSGTAPRGDVNGSERGAGLNGSATSVYYPHPHPPVGASASASGSLTLAKTVAVALAPALSMT